MTTDAGLSLWEAGEATLDLTVVVPYFNPGRLLRKSVGELVGVLDDLGIGYEIIAVSDGSTDGSEETLADLPDDRVRRVSLGRNVGKGQALRVGLSRGRGRYLGFIDADGDVSPDQFGPFVALMPMYQPDIVLGSKRHPMSKVEYPLLRRIYSWGFQQLIRGLFHLTVRDTQTGIKLVRRDVAAAVLPHMVEKRFAFDLELFVVARHLGYTKFFEAPVTIGRRFTSTISWRAVWTMLADTVAIFWRLRVQHYYDLLPEGLPELPGLGLPEFSESAGSEGPGSKAVPESAPQAAIGNHGRSPESAPQAAIGNHGRSPESAPQAAIGDNGAEL